VDRIEDCESLDPGGWKLELVSRLYRLDFSHLKRGKGCLAVVSPGDGDRAYKGLVEERA
jgi:hypothetical protein